MTEVGQKCLSCAPGGAPIRRRSSVLPAFLAIGAVVALVSAVFYVGSDSFQKSGTPRSPSLAGPAPLGSVASDDGLAFRVRSLECTTNPLEVDNRQVAPVGRFCFLTVVVRNDRRVNARISNDTQYLLDATGARFRMDNEATLLYIGPDDSSLFGALSLFRAIPPSETVTGVLVYDVPERGRITEAEFHGSAIGVRVTVQSVTVKALATTTTMPLVGTTSPRATTTFTTRPPLSPGPND